MHPNTHGRTGSTMLAYGFKWGESELMKQGKIGAVKHGKNWRARNGVRIWLKYVHVLNSLKNKEEWTMFLVPQAQENFSLKQGGKERDKRSHMTSAMIP